MANDNFPIIVGVGQVTEHWDGEPMSAAPHPVTIIEKAIGKAISDTEASIVADSIDCAAFVRTFPDSLSAPVVPFGAVENLPRAVLKRIGLDPAKVVYSSAGGEQPQALVNELAAELHAGKVSVALIAGGEVTGALKTALKRRQKLRWADHGEGEIEDRGAQTDFISKYEIENGLGMPPQTYALFEQALRARLGLSTEQYRRRVSAVLARFSEVASANPYSQFPEKRTEAFLAEPSDENYPICDPFLKWHIAQDAVNQSAAVLLTTVGKARELGIEEDKWVYLHGHSAVVDKLVTDRPDLSHSDVVREALDLALSGSGLDADAISFFDIYSCFPSVVLLAAEYLGIDPTETDLTVTGGLPFFGGPGNNYSTHAIAEMVSRLREAPKSRGLVLANGGFMSKQAAGVYSASAPKAWSPQSSESAQHRLDERKAPGVLSEDCQGTIESYCVQHGRDGVERAYVCARVGKDRVLAKVDANHRATMNALSRSENVVGQSVSIGTSNERNLLLNESRLGEKQSKNELGRAYDHIKVERDGRILVVTLNRPKQRNALHSAAHFELAEVFDAYEADQDLWAAIITGAGDKAFCSGNDLKVTARGGNMSMPSSGFAGLCARTNREKPIIAAVNGVAMGGGLEIVLACDLAIADQGATFALPEVKVGLFAAAGGVQRLVRQIGRKDALELILTGKGIDAETAKGLGLINRVSMPGLALEHAFDLATAICQNSPTSVRASKRVLNQMDELHSWSDVLALSQTEIKAVLKSKDAKEGVQAFAEKRNPVWRNE
ncbi:MAG: enoyl-CoA hydratase-related protein [Hyphomonadaceae bacterium]|nr:enoyl-CoA hydratase-related protein [Hyphomonadaceae bacterium]